ncbi:hypothetical protein FRC00_004136 [Tulasnella sp. 408]|nr:hypothetical protein FRC00_004136 [Tulasnella sp. 408]
MSSNTESPSPTSSPSRPRPTRKATSRSATPPTFKATLNRRSSLAAPVAATTAEHTYFTPEEPTAAFNTAPVAVSDEPQPISNAPPASLQFDPGVTFPAPEQISAPEQQPIPDQNNEDMSRERSDSGASTSRRGSLFGNLARPLRRSGSISDSGASAPALASLLETQQKDQAARDAVKARSSMDAASSDVGSGSEAESNPLAPRRKPKRQNTFSKMVGNLGNAVRRRKTSDGSVEAAAAATAAVAPAPAPAAEELSLLSPPAETSAPTSTIVSPIAETSEITSPIGQESMPIPTPVEPKEAAPEAAVDPAVDLSSPPASPTVEVAPFTIQPAVTPQETPAVPNIEESAVLVEPAQAEVEIASAITKMTPVSSAAADSTFKQKQDEHREAEGDQEQDWEKVGEPQQVRPQASFVYTDDGSLADDSASSYVERTRQAGPSVVASIKDKVKARAAIEDEQASIKATMGDPTDPSERVPPTPYTAAFVAKETAQAEFTPPITPDSDKFPEVPRAKRVGGSKLAGGDMDEKSSFPGNYKESVPDDGTTVEGGLSDLLPSRETVDMAAQYASTLLKKLQARGMWLVSIKVPARQRLHDRSRKKKI